MNTYSIISQQNPNQKEKVRNEGFRKGILYLI